MRITSIFEASVLFKAVQFDPGTYEEPKLEEYKGEALDDNVNEFDRATIRWADAQWLRAFFVKYRRDLESFDSRLSVKDAVRQVIDEAVGLQKELLLLSNGASEDQIDVLFQPLYNDEKETTRYELQKLKAKGDNRQSLIRLYAVKHGTSYVITGGTIKLTRTMEERPHTKLELYKLEIAKKFIETLK